MRILIDTNVLISAALTGGVPYLAYIKAVTPPCYGLVCEQNINELKRVFSKKFPNRLSALNRFLYNALSRIELVPVPVAANDAEAQIRDKSDRLVLRAAIAANADVILTGDKDFLEAGLECPKALTPAQFMRLQC